MTKKTNEQKEQTLVTSRGDILVYTWSHRGQATRELYMVVGEDVSVDTLGQTSKTVYPVNDLYGKVEVLSKGTPEWKEMLVDFTEEVTQWKDQVMSELAFVESLLGEL